MTTWTLSSEEVSIVLVGSFNPRIFHPEWLISRDIVSSSWDYETAKSNNPKGFVVSPDFTTFDLPNNQRIEVLLDRFVIRTTRRSDMEDIRDKAIKIFERLSETPVRQMGMNYLRTVAASDKKQWLSFGEIYGNKDQWDTILPYANKLDSNQKKSSGIWEITYNYPRPDDLSGYVRAKFEAIGHLGTQKLKLNVNNHVDIKDQDAMNATEILKERFSDSIEVNVAIIENILES